MFEVVAGEMIPVSATSEHADGAWAFARSFLEPSYQDHLSDAGDSNGLPVLRSSLQARVRRAMRKEDSTYMIGNTQLKYRPLSEGEAQELLDFFDGVDAAGGMDRQILNIILEETKGYLAGQKSAQEVSKVIQSRVRTYIQEKS